MINFNTKLDLERQSKILSGHTAIFDGGVSFGIPFSGFPSGVDTGTTILTSYNVVTGETSGYSGTTGTTFFGITPVNPSAFTDSRIISGTSGLTSVITGTSSNYIQTYGPIWDLTSSTIIDEHLVGLTYSGYQITYFFNNVSASTPTTFNAYVDTRVDYYSANTLDYKGSTNWLTIKGNATVDERLTVNRLTITSGASIGYLLSSVDSDGMAEWIPSSGFVFSGGSGNCITDLYVTNVFGCSPITMHDDTIISGSTSKKLGINTSPSYTFEVLSQDGNSSLIYDDTTNSQNLTLSGKTNGLYYVDVAATDVGLLRMGVVGKSYTGVTNFGATGDSYVYSSVLSNGLNIISSPGGLSSTTNDYIRFYAGNTAVSQPDLHIQGSGATRGNIGIGTTDPKDTLHIKGNAGILTLEGNDHVYMNFYPDGYSAGRKGWFGFGNSPDDNITLSNQTVTGGTMFRTNDIARMFISASGNSGNVGIGTITPSEKLHVYGNTIISTGGTGSRLGINTTPTHVIHAVGNKSSFYLEDSYTSGIFDGARQMIFDGDTDTAPQYVLTDGVVDIGIGVRGTTTSNTTYMENLGIAGDTFIAASANANGLNIMNFAGSGTEDFIRLYAGQYPTEATPADIHIGGTGATRGYVGIGTQSPSEKLHVSGNAIISTGGTGSRLGINTTTPSTTLHAVKNSSYLQFDESSVGPYLYVVGTSTQKPEIATGDGTVSIGMGVRGLNNTTNSDYGNKGDSYIYSEVDSKGLNIIQALGTGPNYIRFYANQYANNPSHMHIQGTGTTKGYVGIGTESPTEKLDVNGRTKTTTLQITSGATPGYVLTSDASGVGSWQAATGGGSGSSITIFTTGSTNDNAIYDLVGSHTLNNVSDYSIIAGGNINTISSSSYSGIFAGSGNTIENTSFYSVIAGGTGNTINGHSNAFMGGGSNNTIDYCPAYPNGNTNESIIGGRSNNIYRSFNSTIIGGYNNDIDNSSVYGGGYNTVIGGTGNTLSVCSNSILLGGNFNKIGDNLCVTFNSSIVGGSSHFMDSSSDNCSIIGGFNHTINTSSDNTIILGGSNITATTSNMVYVPDLIIDGLVSVIDLQTNASGQLIDGASDARLKENINQLQNSLSIVKNLRGVSFEYTQESNMGNGLRYGFIAQEVQEFVPDIVRSRVKGDGMLSLSYTEIIPLLVESVKEIATGQTTNVIVEYTPTSSSDIYGVIGEITRDDNYLYVKGNNGWKRTNLESF